MARIAAKIKQDPQFKALVAALGSEEKAKVAFDRLHPVQIDPRYQALVDAGFTDEQAKKALAEADADPAEEPKVEEAKPEPKAKAAKPAKKAEPKLTPVTPLSSKERAEALVTDKGFEYTKGRVYGGPSLAEAIVRVHKTGKPEIVTSSGVGRTKAVLVYKEDSGDVALQNLTKA